MHHSVNKNASITCNIAIPPKETISLSFKTKLFLQKYRDREENILQIRRENGVLLEVVFKNGEKEEVIDTHELSLDIEKLRKAGLLINDQSTRGALCLKITEECFELLKK